MYVCMYIYLILIALGLRDQDFKVYYGMDIGNYSAYNNHSCPSGHVPSDFHMHAHSPWIPSK